MYKLLTPVALALSLSACGGSTSGDTPSESTAGTDTVGTSTGMDGTGADAGSSTNGDGGDTTGTATGGDTDDGATTNGTSAGLAQIGIVDILNEVIENRIVGLNASFFSFTEDPDLSTISSSLRSTTEECDVTVVEVFNGAVSSIPSRIGGTPVTTISAGDVLTISSPAGSYAELSKVDGSGFVIYETSAEVTLSTPSPSNLAISIPGEQFPAFTSVPMPAIVPLLLNSPVGDNVRITANTMFEWIANDDPNSYVDIRASSNVTADFMQTSVNCTVIDDGSFEFPAEIQAELGEFSAVGTMTRQGFSIVEEGDAMLFLRSSSVRSIGF